MLVLLAQEQREKEALEGFKEWQRLLILKCTIAEELALQENDE